MGECGVYRQSEGRGFFTNSKIIINLQDLHHLQLHCMRPHLLIIVDATNSLKKCMDKKRQRERGKVKVTGVRR